MKRSFLVNENYINCRLDRWIKKNGFVVPQSLIEKNIRKGKIKVNNKREKSSYKLKKNDKIDFYNIEFYVQKKDTTKKYSPTKKDLKFSSQIFIENNENFCVINKPPGISVQSGTKSIKNIIDILDKTKEFDGYKPFTVHRIDKETTGALLVAKNRKYAQLFTSLFRIRKINKIYLGLVLGQLDKSRGTFIDYLIHHEGKKQIKSKAITHFNVLDSNNKYSFIKLQPETGRKHQIRKQLLVRGHPILGDTKYRISINKKIKKQRLMLHAYKISFSINEKKFNFIAEIPSDFKNFLVEKYLKNYL